MNLASTINQMKRIMKYQAENTVSSFFYYMWNAWSEEERKAVYGGMYPHFWENGAWRQTRAHSARRNGSTWNSRKTTAGFWWNGPSRYMTDDTSEKGTVTPKIKQYARKHYQSDRQLMQLQSNGSTGIPGLRNPVPARIVGGGRLERR